MEDEKDSSNIKFPISHVPTCELVKELMHREGVEVNTIGPTATISLSVDGPAIVLTVID